MVSQSEIINFRTIRNVPETVNVTFEFFRQNFSVVWRSLLFLALPPIAIAMALMGYFMYDVYMTAAFGNVMAYGDPTDLIGSMLLGVGIGGIMVSVGSAMLIAVVHELAALYVERGPGNFTVSDVWEGAKRDFWLVLGTLIGLGVASMVLSLVAMFIPFGSFGIYILMVLGSLYFPLRIYHRRGFLQSFVVSSKLLKGRFWATVGLLSIFTLLSIGLAVVTALPVVLIGMVGNFLTFDLEAMMRGDDSGLFLSILLAVYYASSLLLYAVPLTGLIFHFYNQQERHEWTGLLETVETIGPESTALDRQPDSGSQTGESPSMA